jgi:hypothetical protein
MDAVRYNDVARVIIVRARLALSRGFRRKYQTDRIAKLAITR